MLTEKEKNLLEDLQNGEKLCMEKYRKASDAACDGTLRSLFSEIATVEEGHYNTVSSMLQGTVPEPKTPKVPAFPSTASLVSHEDSTCKAKDAYLLSDLLATEKYIASVYNVSVFEFSDEKSREVLNGIQTEEQNHGKMLSDYMQANNMYC